uniref:NADH dehydrogenase subunit 6 n=1 Tax=Bryanellocoris orientalis TaxID=2813430 RepID=A0A8T9W0S0_9HEMI|nr:NADH dehydrogenase subunit 6 [Bryanellocoris orientalis]UPI55322.1 NADH dehydrogenase subunit 6 [Bryanellocoris orientalis]
MLMLVLATLSLLFMWMNHPLMMGIIIILQTITISIMVGNMLKSFWFSYILIIIMLSGMLVLFMYMASIASNEKFIMLNYKTIMIFSSIMLMFITFFWYYNVYIMNNFLSNKFLDMTLSMLFNSEMMYITILMVLYLLLTMVVVSKIVNINNGPLRINK